MPILSRFTRRLLAGTSHIVIAQQMHLRKHPAPTLGWMPLDFVVRP